MSFDGDDFTVNPFQLPFPAQLTAVTLGTGADSATFLYTWTEQAYNATGSHTPAMSPRQGNDSISPAVEINNRLIGVPVYVWMRYATTGRFEFEYSPLALFDTHGNSDTLGANSISFTGSGAAVVTLTPGTGTNRGNDSLTINVPAGAASITVTDGTHTVSNATTITMATSGSVTPTVSGAGSNATITLAGATLTTTDGTNTDASTSTIFFGSGLTYTKGTGGSAGNDTVTGGAIGVIPMIQAIIDTTGAIAAGTIISYATTPGGTFRVGGYVTITAISVDVLQFQCTYTDENSNVQTQTFFPQGLTSANLTAIGAFTFPTMTIRVKAGTTIVLKTVLTVGGGSITFDVGAYVEQLD